MTRFRAATRRGSLLTEGISPLFPGWPQKIYRKLTEPARCRLRSMGCLL
jgi:hypothetical protein